MKYYIKRTLCVIGVIFNIFCRTQLSNKELKVKKMSTITKNFYGAGLIVTLQYAFLEQILRTVYVKYATQIMKLLITNYTL